MRQDYQRYDVLTSLQTITGSFVNIGERLNVLEYDTLTLFFNVSSNNSTAIQVKVLGRLEDIDHDYVLPIKTPTSAKTSINNLVYEFNETDPQNVFSVDVQGVPFVQLQIKGTGNAPIAGFVLSIYAYGTKK
jgi:hypothetical protein